MGGPALAGGSVRLFTVTGACGVPSSARSISANVTVVQPRLDGYLSVFPADVSPPATSTVNFRNGRTRANNLVVALSSDGRGAIAILNGSTADVDVVLDVSGFFR
jgi:hypothetical protein